MQHELSGILLHKLHRTVVGVGEEIEEGGADRADQSGAAVGKFFPSYFSLWSHVIALIAGPLRGCILVCIWGYEKRSVSLVGPTIYS
jgi:hypothetical protein